MQQAFNEAGDRAIHEEERNNPVSFEERVAAWSLTNVERHRQRERLQQAKNNQAVRPLSPSIPPSGEVVEQYTVAEEHQGR